MAKKNNYINTELDWAEQNLDTWKEYINFNLINELKDRIEFKLTAKGGVMLMVIASIEQQGKFIQETMKNYLSLLEIVNNLREKEDAKESAARGDNNISDMSKRFGKL